MIDPADGIMTFMRTLREIRERSGVAAAHKFVEDLYARAERDNDRKGMTFLGELRARMKQESSNAEDDRIARLKRKAQWLNDRAYNKALEDLVSANPNERNREEAHRLRRAVRHTAEFG